MSDSPHFVSINAPIFAVSIKLILKVNNLIVNVMIDTRINTMQLEIIFDSVKFAKNPKGLLRDSPLMMAYRSFNPIAKTPAFTLMINWTIGFLGLDANPDDHFHSGDTVKTDEITKRGFEIR